MRLDSAFDVTAPIDQVWATLMDFERVAGCLPGAQVLNTLSEDAYQVGMKVKLGPVTMTYKGQLEVVERKPEAHQATLRGKAKEARGQGTAEATAQLALVSDGPVTHGTVSAEVSLSGRAAAMGQSVINSVTEQMMAQFATNLQVLLSEPEAPVDEPDPQLPAAAAREKTNGTARNGATTTVPAAPAADGVPTVTADALTPEPDDSTLLGEPPVAGPSGPVGPNGGPAPAPVPPPPAVPATASEPATAPVPAAASIPTLPVAHQAPLAAAGSDNSLDALALARGIAEAQLREPKKALALVAFVAFLAYLLGRRAGRRR